MRTRSNLATERSGVNFVRKVVEDTGCLFKEINLQHDFGHDATIVLVIDNQVQPREIALQIKSGSSYNSDAGCHLPATADHIDFWARHDLTTLGVVYDPAEEAAYWVDLRADCRARRNQRLTGGATISVAKASWNRFDATHFPTVLIPIFARQPTDHPTLHGDRLDKLD
ncbi:DUF4365 domain-containing protein [Sphingomonas sp. PB4P5]|uniref:DUF4365 domain-containing protein n=1 Tax=Parasphingomonas puruogangriensis TaxID=3096155 RepID=UPI002FC5B8BF